MEIFNGIVADLGEYPFLHPYFMRQFGRSADAPEPTAAVRIVSDASLADSPDSEFSAYCSQRALPVLTLICPAIIATSMTGFPMEIARRIYTGTYVNIKGNAARISVVHAIDIARAAERGAGFCGSLAITDGSDHTIDALADALAYRICDKRILTLPHWLARFWYSEKLFHNLTSDSLLADTFRLQYTDFIPTNVVNYLRTHEYNEQSL